MMWCPCGSADHDLPEHPTSTAERWHPVFGWYVMDDSVAEHRDGEHEQHPAPDGCPACALVWS